MKPDGTEVTDADRRAEEIVREMITKQCPDDSILGEEFGATTLSKTPYRWVIDPLDGTSNFALGVHYWGVSIARVVDGWPDIAALYFPVFGELYTARRGGGAHLNGAPLRTAPAPLPRPVAFFACDSRVHRHYHVNLPYKARILGSAAYNFCALARGIATIGFETTPRIWDLAASWLVLEEAGGALHPYQNAPFPLQPATDYKSLPYPILGAENQETLTLARQQITPKQK
ncbi:MAG: hypothetical protein HUU38_32615 [Anaerolineales bacterium]|nr:hypothetical protein [Anaerolineales bacterium]